MTNMDHPFPDGLPYRWNSVPDYWPQRLIHIPTMTSVQRDDDNTYRLGDRKVKEPEYGTLSYTWGRWRVEGPEASTRAALPVKGTPWAIPPIDSEHFTVEAFGNVIKQIAERGNLDWVWVDIGCIDQRRDDAASHFVNTQAPIEIGQQTSIFKRAKSTYVWLSRTATARLSAAMKDVQQHGLDLDDYVRGEHRSHAIPDGLLQDLEGEFQAIFGDPWFSSLWTLQEVVLRNDALVLSAEGEPVPWDDNHSTYLTMFINYCQNVYQILELALQLPRVWTTKWRVSDRAVAAMERIKQQILQAGFYYLFSTNPNVQYGTARYRTASREEDRIYGIMQIYNLRVGASARPGEKPKLRELVPEFAGAINRQSAILGQLFVHTAPQAADAAAARWAPATWQITEESFVPDALMIYRGPVDLATITAGRDGRAVADGRHCPFPALLQASQQDGQRRPFFAIQGMGLRFDLFLDQHVRVNDASASRYPFKMPVRPRLLESYASGRQIDYEKVLVLHLGHIAWIPRSPGDAELTRRHVGLLLYPAEQAHEVEDTWMRVGVCVWSEEWSVDLLESIPWSAPQQMVLI